MLVATWSGAAVFAGSLLYFLYFYVVTLGDTGGSTTAIVPSAIVVNIALFAVFAVHHSALARSGAKAWVGRVLAPALERTAYVWMASLLLIAVCVLWQHVPGVAWRADGPGRWVLYGVQLLGAVLSVASARVIDVWDLAGVSQVSRAAAARRAPMAFKVEGPYAVVRHPIYLGWILLVFGTPSMTFDRLLFAAISSAYVVLAIPLEERTLISTHGARYLEYQRRVRARLVPYLW
jgi:protein-S-isoprenylcysteine O-methyltransferase Ste14